MTIVKYNDNDKTQISKHFNVSEFKCKCGTSHNIYIDSNLVAILEKTREKLNAKACNIYSGFRCVSHDKNIGASGNGPHTQGYAVDCYFLDQDRKRIPSQNVCLALEDLGHHFGIGYRCGGSTNESGNTHIDTKQRKWYGDESISMTKSCCNSFYEYFHKEKKNSIKYQVYDNTKKKWLNEIIIGQGIGRMSYAGNFGNPIGGIRIDTLKYRVHDKKKNKWLHWINGKTNNGILSYAGNLGNSIDGIQIYNAIYRVHIKNGNWLNWINKVDETANGYAGIYGKEIDAIQIK